jgi:hypothetical protein
MPPPPHTHTHTHTHLLTHLTLTLTNNPRARIYQARPCTWTSKPTLSCLQARETRSSTATARCAVPFAGACHHHTTPVHVVRRLNDCALVPMPRGSDQFRSEPFIPSVPTFLSSSTSDPILIFRHHHCCRSRCSVSVTNIPRRHLLSQSLNSRRHRHQHQHCHHHH